MSSFYTSVIRYGNMILLRGYEDHKRITRKVKFSPTLFIPSKKSSEYKTLDGKALEPMKFDTMRDAKDFVEKYEGVSNFSIYGNTNYVAQFIAENYPGEINFDKDIINVSKLDIEVQSNEGFPEPHQAKYPITAITIKNNIDNTYYTFGLDDYDVDKRLDKNWTVIYTKCASERELIIRFIHHFSSSSHMPDAISGWNIRAFDIPYLVNRAKKIVGEDITNKLSPWSRIEEKTVTIYKKEVQMYDIVGIPQLDYMDLFIKFGYKYGPQESYSLNHIAGVVLGEGKLEYEGALWDLYKSNHQKFIDYNIRDVYLVDKIDDKTGLLALCFMMTYKAGCNYSDTFGTVAIWDTLIYRNLIEQNIVVPFSKNASKQQFEGGFVKDPQRGVHDWVFTFDAASLYPNNIVQWNMSPETYLDGEVNTNASVEACLNGFKNPRSDCSMAANGQYFSNAKQGFLPKIVIELFDKRVIVKNKQLEREKELELCDKSDKNNLYRIERDIARFENEQMAIKILLNSLFGALGNNYFRFFKKEIAESITLSGQLIIKTAEKSINEYLNKHMNTDKDYVIAIDTDSTIVRGGEIVNTVIPNASKHKKIEFVNNLCKDIEKNALTPALEKLASDMNVYVQRTKMKREVIADRGIWIAAKRYILNVLDKEGVRYAEPKLKIMGVEAIKSSTPAACREAFKELFKVLMSGTEEETQKFIRDFRSRFSQLPIEEKAAPRSVSDVDSYVDEQTMYIKGTPINSRAAILYNHLLKKHQLKLYTPIRNGDKIRYIHLYTPNPINENVIGFIDHLPDEFGLSKYVDNDTQFEKTFLKPTLLILDAIGWKAEPVSSLDDFLI